ncbi:LysR substrate-binding domain-containing protein [Acidovorax sp. SDU_ACID1]|uniref:LysR substrate-binding domain-containing protein n=1 Tax=Acidovorax sp. SDU_ACID1 TaxID=3136632 RepID=UPI003873A0EE
MDLRQLRQFVVLATELNYRRAAERLNMTQPPLSIAIKRLEEDLGVKLFERDRLGVRLTVPGGVFLDEACRLLENAEIAVQTTRDADRGRIGTLRLCSVPSAAILLLPQILPVFTQRFPSIRIALSSGSTVQILGDLQQGGLDAAFVVPPASKYPEIEYVQMPRQELLLAVPSAHKVAQRRHVKLSDLGDEPLVALAHSDSPGFAGEIMASCQREGFHPKILQESSHALVTLPLVSAGLGMAIVPAALKRVNLDNVTYVELHNSFGAPLFYAMALAYHRKNINPAVRQFIATAREIFSPEQTTSIGA